MQVKNAKKFEYEEDPPLGGSSRKRKLNHGQRLVSKTDLQINLIYCVHVLVTYLWVFFFTVMCGFALYARAVC